MVKNKVLQLISGTALAQIISIIFLPIIARIFSPADIGNYSFLTSVTLLLVPIVTLSLPSALVKAPRHQVEGVYTICIIFAIFSSTLITLFAQVFVFFYQPDLPSYFTVVLGLSILSYSFFQLNYFLKIRNQEFKKIAFFSVVNSGIHNALKVTLGLISSTFYSLSVSSIVSYFYHAYSLKPQKKVINLYRYIVGRQALIRFKLIVKRQSDFIYYRTPEVTISTLSQSIPIFILAIYFSAESAGYYAFSKILLSAPLTLIGKAFFDAFYPTYVNLRKNDFDLFIITFKRHTLFLAVLGIVFASSFWIMKDDIFSILFGKEWIPAANYAGWISIWMASSILIKPSSVSVLACNLQKLNLYYSFFSVSIKLIVVFASIKLDYTALDFLKAFVASSVFINLAFVLIILSKARSQNDQQRVI